MGVGVWASAAVERQARTKAVSSGLIVIPLPAFSAQTAFAIGLGGSPAINRSAANGCCLGATEGHNR